MRIIRHIPALLVLLLLTACDGSLGSRDLRGEWLHRVETETGEDWSRLDLRLELRGDGSYTWGSTTHASWGRPSDDLLGYSREHGRWEVERDSLFLTPDRLEWWDYLTGGPYERDRSGFAPARYRARVVGNRLVLNYVSYPADAAQETELVFRRD